MIREAVEAVWGSWMVSDEEVERRKRETTDS